MAFGVQPAPRILHGITATATMSPRGQSHLVRTTVTTASLAGPMEPLAMEHLARLLTDAMLQDSALEDCASRFCHPGIRLAMAFTEAEGTPLPASTHAEMDLETAGGGITFMEHLVSTRTEQERRTALLASARMGTVLNTMIWRSCTLVRHAMFSRRDTTNVHLSCS